ncbi:MAG: SURF1 family protein [Maricaulaceae bacterium]
MSFRPLPGLTLAALPALALLLGLGVWQLQRDAWKADLITTLDARIAAQPIPLSQALEQAAQGEDVRFTRVRVSGRFADPQTSLALYGLDEGRPGARAFAVFETEAAGAPASLLVDRGWTPRGFDPAPSPERPLTLIGRLRPEPKPGWFTPPNTPDATLWYRRKVSPMLAALQAARPLEGWFVELETPTGAPWPQPAPLGPELSDRHLVYALTWFGLAATLAGVYLAVHRQRGRF